MTTVRTFAVRFFSWIVLIISMFFCLGNKYNLTTCIYIHILSYSIRATKPRVRLHICADTPEQSEFRGIRGIRPRNQTTDVRRGSTLIKWRQRHRNYANTITSSTAAKRNVTSFHKMLSDRIINFN